MSRTKDGKTTLHITWKITFSKQFKDIVRDFLSQSSAA